MGLSEWGGRGKGDVVAATNEEENQSAEIEPVELQTTRLLLRQLREEDLPELVEVIKDKRIYETTLRVPHPYTMERAREWFKISEGLWATGTGCPFTIFERDSGTLVGGTGLEIVREHERAELGFWVGVPYWGRGYTTEAAHAVLGFGFGRLGLHRICACHFAGNDASGRVQQKLGMTREGVLRHQFKKDGRYIDDVMYSILADEFEPDLEKLLTRTAR